MGGIIMSELKQELEKALSELRKCKERKFDQTVDLIVNLQKFNLKKTNINLFISIPNKIKNKKIAGFLETENPKIKTITLDQFKKYKDKKKVKNLVKNFDFFIAQASLMPKVASTFGRILGPAGKMPSPQLGIILNTDDKTIDELKEKINNNIKIKVKEASIKLAIGKKSMKDKKIIENVLVVYNAIIKEMPKDKENIKNIELKFTMTKPIKINLK
jgi:large subunit ribosomal protein L1